MPTTYAHYRFGRDVLARLPEGLRQEIIPCQAFFDLGVHGPDLLFYYRALTANPVRRLGDACHRQTGREFFSQRIPVARQGPPEARAYLYGVLCHFALDRECHPCVGEKERTGVSHSAIEASFDRCLMEKDGLDPVRHNVTGHLCPSREAAGVIAPFYPPLAEKTIYRAQKSMVFDLRMLIASGLKRRLLLLAMGLVGQKSLGDLLVPLQQNPLCEDSDIALCQCYDRALTLAETMLRELECCLRGEGQLGVGFDHSFGEE